MASVTTLTENIGAEKVVPLWPIFRLCSLSLSPSSERRSKRGSREERQHQICLAEFSHPGRLCKQRVSVKPSSFAEGYRTLVG